MQTINSFLFQYHQITIIDTVIGGDVSSCVLVQALYDAYQNTSFSTSERSQLYQLYNKTQVYFEENTDISLRLNFFVSIVYSQWQLSSFDFYLEIIVDQISCGEFGYIYDLIFCSNICVNSGCGNVDNGAGTPPVVTASTPSVSASSSSSSAQESSTVEVSTSEASTVVSTAGSTASVASTAGSTSSPASTTQATVSTTIQPANCVTRW